jgi:septal ring factor EnvC (AmiA/AmiB activator)
MTQPEESLLHEELIETNRELVAVNRQIAESLANLERLYAEDYRKRQEGLVAMQAAIAQMNKGNWYFFPIVAIPMLILILTLVRL